MQTDSLTTPVVQYFANAVGGVHFLPNAFVYLHWSGAPMTMPEFCALYVHTRNLLQRNKLTRLLADHRRMPPATDEHKDWYVHEWLPATVAETGLSRAAIVCVPDPRHRLHSPDVLAELRHSIQVELFDDVLPAAAWLKQ